MSKTLLEKLDSSCTDLSLRESVRNQVQRIISTRMYLGDTPVFDSWVTGFGLPEIVNEHTNVGDAHIYFRSLLRKKILEFEPRISDVKVMSLIHYTDRASCQLLLRLNTIDIEEQFFF